MNTRSHIRNLGCAAALGVLFWGTGCSSDDDGLTAPLTPNVSDDAPPLPPSGLQVPKADSRGCAVRWSEGAEADLAGYHVYVYDPDPSRPSAYVALTKAPLPRANYVFVPGQSVSARETYYLRISAVDADGHESSLSEILEVRLRASVPGENSEQDPGVGGDPFTDYSGGGGSEGREPPGVPGRNPNIQQPGRR